MFKPDKWIMIKAVIILLVMSATSILNAQEIVRNTQAIREEMLSLMKHFRSTLRPTRLLMQGRQGSNIEIICFFPLGFFPQQDTIQGSKEKR